MRTASVSHARDSDLWLAAAMTAAVLALTACSGDPTPQSPRPMSALPSSTSFTPAPQALPSVVVEPSVPEPPADTADAGTLYLRGIAQWKSGQYEQAEASLERSAALGPGSARTWVNLARVRMDHNDPQRALEAADASLVADPASADGLHQRGRALAALGRTEEALDTLASARSAAPDNGYIANTLGWLLLVSGRPDEAVAPLEQARQQLPEVAYVRNNLGVAYERTGDRARAVEEYRASIAAGDSGGKAAASLARLEPLLPSLPDAQSTVAVVASGPN